MKPSASLRRNWGGLTALVALLTLALAPAAAQAQSEDPTDYVLLANKLVRIGRSSNLVSGNVAVSSALSQGGGVLLTDRQLITGDGTHLVSDAVELRGPASIYSIFANDASLGSQLLVRAPCGSGACSFPAPVFSAFPTIGTITPGTAPVTVGARTTITLPPGDYGALKTRGRGTIVFSGGTYNFSEFNTGKFARLLFTAPTTINVAGRLQFGPLNSIGPIGPGVQPQDILFQCTGDRVRIKPRTTMSARLWAPSSRLLVGFGSLIKGQLIADEARLDRGIVLQSSYPLGPFEVRTLTPTHTPLPTNTAPPTPTPTNTPLATLTPTPVDTGTATPVPTNTPLPPDTPAPTDTPLPTSTPQPTDTPLPTATPLPTNTLAPTATNTPASTPTDTAVPTVTDTPRFSPTPTFTNEPGATATFTPTSTPTSTHTDTFTPTSTPTFTHTNTPSHTPTSTRTSTVTQTPTPTSTFTSTSTRTATATRTATLTRTPTATTTSTATPTRTSTPGQAVRPILECVVQNGPGSYTAYFGYLNENPTSVSIPVGPANFFSPAPDDRGQPSTFSPGRTPYWPNAAFSVGFDGSTLVWSLTGPDGATRTSTAGANSTPCSEHVYLEKTWYDEDGHLLSSPPGDLPANYTLTATSSLGSATCSYSGGSLQCTYSNPGFDGNGLWVPAGGSYTVSEADLPGNFGALAGIGSFAAQVPGGHCVNPYLGLSKNCLHTVKNIATNGCSGSFSPEGENFEQIGYITQVLGGTVTQVGGSTPGASLSSAASFGGSVTSQTGVSVSIPNYIFASSVIGSNLSGNSEPGNVPSIALGAPTDLTFTTPGSGGPDGAEGDGGLVLASSGNFLTVGFGSTICTATCSQRALVVFTDTALNGTAQIELLLAGSPMASLNATLNGGAVQSAIGGVAFNISNLSFDQVKISRLSGTVEIDAIAVRGSSCGAPLAAAAPCGNGVREGGEECDDGNTSNADGCSSDCRTEYDLLDGARYCSLSQGGWKGPNGVHFTSRAPSILPVTIGGPDFSTTIHSEDALHGYLPKGGAPHAISAGERHYEVGDDVESDDDGSGVLGGQAVALSLATTLSKSGEVFEHFGDRILPARSFCTQRLSAGGDGFLGTEDDALDGASPVTGPWSFPANVVGTSNTVNDLLLMANQYLRGSSCMASIGEVNSALDTLNNAFDGCRQVVPCP